ncbi:MAG: 3-deoxy-manno-octulosonate cytidylyltransferase [Nannocystaceae bacterium]
MRTKLPKREKDMDFTVVIPARYASSRLPGKPLLEVEGHPILWYVWKNATESEAKQVIIATDDKRVFEAAAGWGAIVHLTPGEHRTGTDRIADVVTARGFIKSEVIVNVQADDPLMPSALINQVAELWQDGDANIATLCERILKHDEIHNPNVVKVVMDNTGYALYFSRAPIPWMASRFERGQNFGSYFRHLGIYAYQVGYLQAFTALPDNEEGLDLVERLEQLRALSHGHTIAVAPARVRAGFSVDSPDDLEIVRSMMASMKFGGHP